MATWVVLICAVLASLAVGVLAAYGVCEMLFHLLRMRARSLTVASVAREARAASV